VKLPKTRLYVGLVNQVASTHRHLDKFNSSTYNTVRNQAEKPFIQWTYGVEFGVKKNKSQFSMGVQATTESWSSHYQYTYKVYDSLPVRDVSGNIIGYFLVRPRDTSINEQQVIKIQKVQIPFAFTQLWTLNPKLDFITSISGTIGINTGSEGNKIINPANMQMYPYAAIKDQERKISLAPSLSLGVQYKLNNSFSLQGTAFGYYSATSRFKSSFQAKEYPYSIGGSIKVLYFIK
jgi:hypothetical protein